MYRDTLPSCAKIAGIVKVSLILKECQPMNTINLPEDTHIEHFTSTF